MTRKIRTARFFLAAFSLTTLFAGIGLFGHTLAAKSTPTPAGTTETSKAVTQTPAAKLEAQQSPEMSRAGLEKPQRVPQAQRLESRKPRMVRRRAIQTMRAAFTPDVIGRMTGARVGQNPAAKSEVAQAEAVPQPQRLLVPRIKPVFASRYDLHDLQAQASARTLAVATTAAAAPDVMAEAAASVAAPPVAALSETRSANTDTGAAASQTSKQRTSAAPRAKAKKADKDQKEDKDRDAKASGGRRMGRTGKGQEARIGQATPQAVTSAVPEVLPMVGPVSQDQDLRKLPYIAPNREEEEEGPRRRHPVVQGQGINDPPQSVKTPAQPEAMPAPIQSFNGMSVTQSGCGCMPPDTNGDVGPNHYIQSVNSSIKIFDKTGTALNGVNGTTYNSFFSAMGAGTPCGVNQNQGDGFVFYDHLANRWVVSDFAFPAFPGTSFYQCVGVSKTADPVAGGWWLYAVQVDPSNPTFLGDYPKFGLWPDAYYFSVNMFSNNTTFNGVRVFALNRSAMINGTGAPNPGAVAFTIAPADLGDTYSFVPATFRTGSTPPAGRPEYFLAVNSSATAGTVETSVFARRFHVDFVTPANSTFGVGATHAPDTTITVAGFVDAFTSTNGTNLVPQTGTTRLLDTLGDKLMTPLVYHNLSGVESLWATQTVNNNQGGTGPTGVRWYQFNVTGDTIETTPVQQQTYTNGADGLWRWMPSISVDAQGNMSIGFTASSSTTNPAIKYAGRLVNDPLNTLAQGEALLIQGAGHQTSSLQRWGDYSSLGIDPSDSCTFWHTNEYYSATTSGTWNTRIGSFKFPTCTGPTQAKVKTFTANAGADGRVLLQWSSSLEVDNLGYHVYREQNGTRTRITPQLVAGSALLDGPGKSLLSGHAYSWSDTLTAGAAGVRYWLEDIDLNGKSTFNGPYVTAPGLSTNPAEAMRQSLLLSQLGAREAALAGGANTQPVGRTASMAAPVSGALQAQSPLAGQAAVKLAIKQEGLYRVTQAQLVAAGIDPKIDPRSLQVFVDGVEQPIKVTNEQAGHFDSSVTVEFYATGLDVPATDTRVYWLVAGAQAGKRIPTAVGKAGLTATGGFPYTVERKDRTTYFSALKNGDAENFFGAVVASQPVDQAIWVQHLNPSPSATATIDIALQGVTQLAHNVRLQLNGTNIGTLNFTGQAAGKVSLPVSASLLKEGENHVQLITQGGQGDVSLVDSIRITYSHSYTADSNALRLAAQAGQAISIGGFTSSNIRLVDVTDPNAVQEIAGTVVASKGTYAINAAVPGASQRVLLALADSQVKTPAAITTNQASTWRQSNNGADLLIFTRRELAAALQPLVARRQSQGLSVAVIEMEDVYDEFSFGNKTPQAVKDFINYAATNWKKKPQFVLLAGGASYDPRNYLGFGDFDAVPTKLIDTASLETASDDWFADFDNSGLAQVAIGRLPVRSAAETSALIAKIISYEGSSPAEEATLVADMSEGHNFEATTTPLRALLPETLRVTQINRGSDTANARSQLLAAINRGQKIVNYTGHGNVNQWRGNLLTNEDAAALTNSDHLPLFVMMTCLNGYFDDPALESLGGSLLKAERGGAVAVWASSGITLPSDQSLMNQQLYRLMFPTDGTAGLRMGEAMMRAKAAVSDTDVRRTWVLLGDPTMRLR